MYLIFNMYKIKGGCTRTVFLTRRYAIKIPRLNYGWRLFLQGLLCNMQEVHFNTMKDNRMAPILYYVWGGWMLIMPRCKELSKRDFEEMDFTRFQPLEPNKCNMLASTFNVPVELKLDSFGWYEGRIVAIDYGS